VSQEYEETILTALHSFPPVVSEGITVQTPRLYHFFRDTDTQIYSDLPSSLDLKTYALKHLLTQAQCMRFGRALGRWAKEFHSWAAAPEQERLREDMKGNTAMLELKYTINYGWILMDTIGKFPDLLEESKGTFEAVGKKVKEELDERKGSLIHGDFWSGK
jgi:hypothetical protein